MHTLSLILDRLFAGDTASGLVAALLAGAIAAATFASKAWYSWRHRALGLRTKKEDLLLKVLKNENLATMNPLRLERAFQRAYGFAFSSTELRFAALREHSHSLLMNMKRGNRFVKFEATTGAFVRRGRLSLKVLDVGGAILASLALVAMLFVVAFAFVAKSPGAFMIGVELAMLAWICVDGAIAAGAAKRLLDLSNYPPFTPRLKPRAKGGKGKSKRDRHASGRTAPPGAASNDTESVRPN